MALIINPSKDNIMEVVTSRSICMSRKVCCIIVEEDVQVIATDDNNCNEGNCEYYNTPYESGKRSGECTCVHAEENALKIAGKEAD
ncbi:20254_t:CDS:2, partial [Gigaspora margarita]